MPNDVKALCGLPAAYDTGCSPLEWVATVSSSITNPASLIADLELYLTRNPEIVSAWQNYSYNKRWTPAPYLDDKEVGLYDAGYREVTQHSTLASACADFIQREIAFLGRASSDD